MGISQALGLGQRRRECFDSPFRFTGLARPGLPRDSLPDGGASGRGAGEGHGDAGAHGPGKLRNLESPCIFAFALTGLLAGGFQRCRRTGDGGFRLAAEVEDPSQR